MVIAVIILTVAVIFLLPLPIKLKTYLNAVEGRLFGNLSIFLLPTIAITLFANAKEGLIIDSNVNTWRSDFKRRHCNLGKLFEKIQSRFNEAIKNRINPEKLGKMARIYLSNLSIESIAITAACPNVNPYLKALIYGISGCLMGLSKGKSILIASSQGKTCGIDFTIKLKVNLFIILFKCLPILLGK